MKRIFILIFSILILKVTSSSEEPNIVYIMSDELAYFELSHMGNPYIKTPRIDRMAKEGIRFTNAYAGSPVCAPLRCNLMTGKHAGHASVRANDGGTPLREDEITIASVLRKSNYATGGFGKWGCGGRSSTGVPEKHGFEVFYGYYDQVHAHSFYPPYLIKNSKEVSLDGNVGGRSGKSYSHYPIIEEGLNFIRKNKDKKFFAYFPITPPHGMYDIPKDDHAWDLYEGEEWIKNSDIPQDVKNYAAMVSLVDRNVGQILDLLKELNLDENTIVFFTGDNGGQDRFRSKDKPRGFFGPNVNPKNGVEFRGGKGNLYEGGLKIPFIVRWPEVIKAGSVSDHIFYQPDVFPTLAEIANSKVPDDLDGVSFLPALLGKNQKAHDFLYWEFGNQVAVRLDNWKGILNRKSKEWALYDLNNDVSEKNDMASGNKGILEKIKKIAVREHTPPNPGTYTDRTLHERDRWAKWGDSDGQPQKFSGKVNTIKHKNLIPSKAIRLLSFSSENKSNRKLAKFALDGNPRTIWHSRWSDGLVKHPHQLTVDLGSVYNLRRVSYLARQDGAWNGAFADVEIYVSNSPENFNTKPDIVSKLKKDKKPQPIDFGKSIKGRYVKVKILSEVNGGAWASAAEIGFIGKPSE